MPGTNVTTPVLQGFLDAFNAHVDAIMAFFTEDCVFDMPRGPAREAGGSWARSW